MTNSVIVISLNNLPRSFWKFHLNNPKVRIWQWKDGLPSKEMVDLIDPYAIILDDYFTKDGLEKSDGYIPKLLNLGKDKPLFYCSPRFISEDECQKFSTSAMNCLTFSDEFINQLIPLSYKAERSA